MLEARNSPRDLTIAVAHIAVVASIIVVRITHDGTERAPLIAGTTKSRAVTAGLLKTPTDCTTFGLLAARLSSHSVFPKACKKHLRFSTSRDWALVLISRRREHPNASPLKVNPPRRQLSSYRDP